jgi:glutamine synthetase
MKDGGAVRGKLTPEDLGKRVRKGEIDTVLVGVTDLYGRLVGKRYDADFFLEDVLEGSAHFCDYLLTADMEMEPVGGYEYANWQEGYGDMHVRPDLGTLRVAAWLDRTALVLGDVVDEDDDLVPFAPRSLLRRQVARLAAAGLSAKAGSELEFYVFRDSYREAHALGFEGLEPAGWVIEDYHALQGARHEPLIGAMRRHLRDSGVPVETSKGEWGRGQHELNVRYADVIEMADRHVVYKQCAKETADAQGCSLTFMAKLDEAQAGSSCHVHLSLWRGAENAFAGEDDLGGVRCSETFRHFLGGWIAHASDLMPFLAPNPNSYKRFQAASWAPTRLAWSRDNRTAGFRVVGEGESLRIECRIPGADCNPYLVYAAALAAGLDGIERKIDPPPPFDGDAYAAEDQPRLPLSLRDAVAWLRASELASAALGEDVVEHYAHFFEVEQAACDRAVTDWERRRYFEQI